MTKPLAVLGLSGGVDSAVSARVLADEGFSVLGVFLDFGFGDPAAAARLALDLGIAFLRLPMAEPLAKHVQRYFIDAYACAETPNPCIRCNETVKFPALSRVARERGAAVVATGHYAQISLREDGSPLLRKYPGPKDQSYMLYRVPRPILAMARFPMASFASKEAVRTRAKELSLPVFDQKDSMDVCFLQGGAPAAYLEENGCLLPPGDFVDEAGRVLGRHRGLHRYTPGQRKGLGVAASGRLYVKRLSREQNQVVLSLTDTRHSGIALRDVVYLLPEYEAMDAFDASIKVRYARGESGARVHPLPSGRARVIANPPVRGVAPGQSVVFYRDNVVVGGGVIEEAHERCEE